MKPEALGWKLCHWISTLKAAMVNASRACTKRPMGVLFTISPVSRDRLVGRLRHTCRV